MLGGAEYENKVPLGDSELQLFQQVLIEFVELWEGVQDLVEETLLDHGFPGLTSGCGHGTTEVLQAGGGT